MPDTTVLTDKPVEEKKEKTLGQEVREKSFQQLLKEEATSRQNPKPTEPIQTAPVHTEEDDKKAEDERLAKEAEDAKRQIEADEKRQTELATKAAEEVITKQKEEEQAKLDKIRQEEEEKRRQDDLKPKFTGKDEQGNSIPSSYDELSAESIRVAKELAKQEIRKELAAKEKERETQEAQKAQTVEQQKMRQKAYEDELQKELDQDLTDLYTNNKLPKITNRDDENDIGNKEFKNLFETAQRVNAERIAKGEPPIRSIKLIYYEHYKPLSTLPGHDAPVLGSESPLSQELPEDRYIVSRDRHKSTAQLLKEERERLTRKMNVRGV